MNDKNTYASIPSRQFQFWVSLSAFAAIFFSCDKDPIRPPEPDEMAEYTVMYYVCGADDTDHLVDFDINSTMTFGSTDKVKATAQVKYSPEAQLNSEYPHGTRRFIMKTDGPEAEVVMDASLRLDDPENLADFISWSKTHCPARKYILVLIGHGSGFVPNETVSRAALYDDNTETFISVGDLVSGVKLSGTRLELLFYNCCLMNTLENLGELTDITKYTLASGHSMPAYGDHSGLMTALNEQDNLIDAIRDFCRVTFYHWDMTGIPKYDLVLTELTKLPEVFSLIRDVSDELCRDYDEFKAEYNSLTNENFYLYDEEYFLVDIASYVEAAAIVSFNPKLLNLSSRLISAADKAIVYQTHRGDCPDMLTWSVNFTNRNDWQRYFEPYGNYVQLDFDRQTGWSNWLRLNETPNSGLVKK